MLTSGSSEQNPYLLPIVLWTIWQRNIRQIACTLATFNSQATAGVTTKIHCPNGKWIKTPNVHWYTNVVIEYKGNQIQLLHQMVETLKEV